MPLEVVVQVFGNEWALRGVTPAGGPVVTTTGSAAPSVQSSPQATGMLEDAVEGVDKCEVALPVGAALQLPGAVLETPPMSREGSSSNLLEYVTPN